MNDVHEHLGGCPGSRMMQFEHHDEEAAQQALQASGKFIPWQIVTISRDGRILD